MPKVAVVEDDTSIRDLVLYALQNSGYDAVGLRNARELYTLLETETPDLFLLDIMLDDEDGYTILEKLKQNRVTKQKPVIMLTAKTAEMDKVRGLDLGADDYITKPFGVMEMLSRIKAVLRRTAPEDVTHETLSFGPIHLDLEKRMATVGEAVLTLTYKEFELLAYFLRNANVVLSRNQMMDAVWGYNFSGETRTVDVHVRTLRAKLGDAAKYIHTIRNVGYRLGD